MICRQTDRYRQIARQAEVKVKWKLKSLSRVPLFSNLWTIYSPWNSPGQNTGVDSLSLLQGIFPTQGLNPGLLNCRQILYQLSHKGSPRILEWVAYPFSSGPSKARNRTRVSCTAGGFFTNWAIREALIWYSWKHSGAGNIHWSQSVTGHYYSVVQLVLLDIIVHYCSMNIYCLLEIYFS